MTVEIVEFIERSANRQPSAEPFVTLNEGGLLFSSHLTPTMEQHGDKLKIAKVKMDGVVLMAIVPSIDGDFLARKTDKQTRMVLTSIQAAKTILEHYKLETLVGKGKKFPNHRFDIVQVGAPQDMIVLMPPKKFEK